MKLTGIFLIAGLAMAACNGAGGGGNSSPPPNSNPVPSVSSLSPSLATVGTAAQTLTINGTGFISTSTVTYKGVPHTASFVGSTQLTIQLSAGDQASAGSYPVVVTNPAPGGGISSTVNFTVDNPVPSISSLSPNGVTVGGAAFTLTVNGTGFVSASQVKFNGNARSTTFVSSTEVTTTVTAADIGTGGTYPVTATNPSPGGGTSVAVNFTVSMAKNQVPTLASISPNSAAVGGAAFTLTLTGTNFIASSTVNFGMNPALTPTSQTATQLLVTIPATYIATAGTVNVIVTNPAPGGGSSNSTSFTVNNSPASAPTITSLSPSAVVVGSSAQTLAITGANFVSGSTVTYHGVAHTATLLSSTQLTIQLTAADQATQGDYSVVVTNPALGGGSSNSFLLAVQPAGSLTIIIQGLPSGINANTTVSSSSGYSQILTQTTTLSGLNSGNYSASAAIVASSSVSNTVFVPTLAGNPATVSSGAAVAITILYGALATTWSAIGPSAIPNSSGVSGGLPGAGKLQAFAASNTNPSLMYAGGGIGPGNSGPYSESGIYKTTNGGSSWAQANAGLTDPAVNALWLDQSNTNNVVAGTDSSTGGIFRSTNGGTSWNLVSTSPAGPISAFLFDGASLHAAAANGIYESTDDGGTWSLAYSSSVPVRALAMGAGVLYAGLDNGTVLVNSSGTWTPTPSQPILETVWSIAVNPTNGQNVFVVEWNGYTVGDLYVTQNGGTTWTSGNSPLMCGNGNSICSVQFVAFDPVTGYLYTAGDYTGVFQSTNSGSSWTQLPSSIWDVRLIVPDAAGIHGNLIVGSDQGLYQSTNLGTTWQSLNSNITSSIVYGLDISGSTILTSVQDYSPIYTFNSGSTWGQSGSSSAPSGEGGSVMFNPGNPQYAYAFTLGQFQLSVDGGHTFTHVAGPQFIGQNGGELIAVDKNKPSNVYVAALAGVYESTNWGQSFTLQSSWPFSSSSQPTMVSVDPTNSLRIFVGTTSGNLEFTNDGGTSWTISNLPVSGCGGPQTLVVDPANPEVILTTIFGCGGGAILRSIDGGANFTVASNGVYNRPTQCLAAVVPNLTLDPSGSGIVAAATTGGTYLSSDFGGNWTSIRGNTVPYPATQAVWSGGYLYQSTCGEGVLRMPFPF